MFARVGLAERADDRVKSYSLGMRQRLGVARALLADPELLILDEPTNRFDPAGIHEFRQMIRQFVEDGMTVLLSSHLLDEVEKVADYVAIVDRGRVVLQGSIADLRRKPSTRFWCPRATSRGPWPYSSSTPSSAPPRGPRTASASRCVRPGPAAAAGEVTRRLVEAGVDVRRVEPVRASLEQRFLEITTRLGVTK